METAITFSDIQIEDQYSSIVSRKDVDISTSLGDRFKLMLPIISANMPDITEYKMALEMYKNGGYGILHRFMSIEENVWQLKKVNELFCCGVSIGVKEEEKERFDKLYEAGAKSFCIDVAHGHCKQMKDMLMWTRSRAKDITIIAGNIATARAALDLAEWGADILKVGIGPGCFIAGTKIKTSKGYKQIEDVKIGDKVLTHRDRYKEVVETTNRKEKKEVYVINGEKCTSNHEFYVLNKKYSKIINDDNIEEYAEWMPADKITKDYMLLKVKNN